MDSVDTGEIAADEDDEECIHGLGPVSACTICNGRDQREQKLKWLCRYTFTAKFQSLCKKCSNVIREGDTVGMTQADLVVCDSCIGMDDPARMFSVWEVK